MENFEIITDSSANLQKALLDIYHIHILTLRFSRDKKEYRSYEEGVDRALDEVYESLRKKEKIETFCVEEKEAYDKIYELTKQGKDVLYIGMSSAMSNTYENVEKAVHRVQKEFPDRKLKSVDSLGVALGEGLLVRCAVELRQEGKSLKKCTSGCFPTDCICAMRLLWIQRSFYSRLHPMNPVYRDKKI